MGFPLLQLSQILISQSIFKSKLFLRSEALRMKKTIVILWIKAILIVKI
jgi:hypothetical protein